MQTTNKEYAARRLLSRDFNVGKVARGGNLGSAAGADDILSHVISRKISPVDDHVATLSVLRLPTNHSLGTHSLLFCQVSAHATPRARLECEQNRQKSLLETRNYSCRILPSSANRSMTVLFENLLHAKTCLLRPQ